MAEKNPYYIDAEDTRQLTERQRSLAKYNNRWLWIIFTNLVAENGEKASSFIPNNATQLLVGNLPYSDRETGVKSYSLGAKLNYLIQQLENNAKAREFFSNSYFSELINSLSAGTLGNSETDLSSWKNYKHTDKCEDKFKGKPFHAASVCYRKDNSAPIGLNMGKLIDCLVISDNKGGYKLNEDFAPFNAKYNKEATQMREAIGRQLEDFKKLPEFRLQFTQSSKTYYTDEENSNS